MTTLSNLLSTLQEKLFTRSMRVMIYLQLFSTIGLSMLFSLLVLYCLFQLHLPEKTAYSLVAAYNALGYALAILGGYFAEQYLGYRFSIIISAILGIIGMLLLMLPLQLPLYGGLACFSLSSGIMTPALFVLLGRLFETTNQQRDNAFLLSYIAMDMGSFLAAGSSGYISTYLSYSWAFALGALSQFIVLVIFLRSKNLYAKRSQPSKKHQIDQTRKSRALGLFLVVLSIPLVMWLLDYANICNTLILLCGAGSAAFIIFHALKSKDIFRGKLLVFLILLCISTAFDALYFLIPSLLTVFTQYNVDRHFLGHLIPTATYSALNPFFVITVGVSLTILWTRLSRKSIYVFAPTKFALGIILMGIGFITLMFGIMHHDAAGYIAPSWIVLSYFLQTVGELLISPTGYAIVGCLSPLALEGIMMGISQFSTGVAGAFSDFLANWIAPPAQLTSALATDGIYQKMFGNIGFIAIAVGIAALCFAPYLQKVGFHERKI